MFTGIIEKFGILESITNHSEGKRIKINIDLHNDAEEFSVNLGDSISVNGVCLTVEEFTKKTIIVFASSETLIKSTINDWKIQEKLNLERALTLSSRLGGHLVSGHVDGKGVLIERKKSGESEIFRFNCPQDILNFIIEKGSIAVDGISLTAFDVDSNGFSAAIIPFTIKTTNLQNKKIGDKVNIEIDMIGKYIHKFFDQYVHGKNISDNKNVQNNITLDILRKSGFLK